jgi:hypothetical protein
MNNQTSQNDQAANDNRSNQCNTNHETYQGHSSAYSGTGTTADLNNHSNQMNPNNPTHASSRGAK